MTQPEPRDDRPRPTGHRTNPISGDHWTAGFDNRYTTLFLSPGRGEGFYWGVGPVRYYPSATNLALDVNKSGSGFSVAFIKEDESALTLATLVNNIWSFGGPPGASDTWSLHITIAFIFPD